MSHQAQRTQWALDLFRECIACQTYRNSQRLWSGRTYLERIS